MDNYTLTTRRLNRIANMHFMFEAMNEGRKGMVKGHGGPFGCVIVKDGKIIAKDHNHVLHHKDPTAHGEISAIRKACKKLRTHDLTGCVMYTTGQCCLMCLSAAIWANIKHIYYACSIQDNADIGFRDGKLNELCPNRKIQLKRYESQICKRAGKALFRKYMNSQHRLY